VEWNKQQQAQTGLLKQPHEVRIAFIDYEGRQNGKAGNAADNCISPVHHAATAGVTRRNVVAAFRRATPPI
jgi:hypothetical protein